MSAEIKIKPLEWLEKFKDAGFNWWVEAETVGNDSIGIVQGWDEDEQDWCGDFSSTYHHGEYYEEHIAHSPTLDEAKAACQQYHEKLVREELLKFVEVSNER